MKTIYYLEDDWNYGKYVITALNEQAAKSGLKWNIIRIPTELQFIELVSDIRSGLKVPPDACILDAMVRYTNPSQEDQPDEASQPPYDRAGIRCMEIVQKEFAQCQIIFLSVLDAQDLPTELDENVKFIAKDTNIMPLFIELHKGLL